MADAKRFGCYDKVVGHLRFTMRVVENALIITTYPADRETHRGWEGTEQQQVIRYASEAKALDAMVEHAADGWRHSDDWPREVITTW